MATCRSFISFVMLPLVMSQLAACGVGGKPDPRAEHIFNQGHPRAGGEGQTEQAIRQPSVAAAKDRLGGAWDVAGLDAGANILWSKPNQTIDGFGVATAWGEVPKDAAQIDALFSVTRGAGLSMLRNRIPFRLLSDNGDDDFLIRNADKTFSATAESNGAKTFQLNWSNWDLSATRALLSTLRSSSDYQVESILSSPWTPPNDTYNRWKVSNARHRIDYDHHPESGGALSPDHYQDYADVLADYALGFKANMGSDLTALSIQNEPNILSPYESADWTAQQIHDFLAVLGTELEKKGVRSTLPHLAIVAAEDANFKDTLLVPTLNDPATSAVLGIVAVHQYEYGPWAMPNYRFPILAASHGAMKRIWLTEYNTSPWVGSGRYKYPSVGIGTALLLAKMIQQDLTVSGIHAYIHWWTSSLIVDGSPSKELWALGQFSRFVRPGWTRITTAEVPQTNVSVSAFVSADVNQLAVVVINDGSVSATVPLIAESGTFGPGKLYRTSAQEDLAQLSEISAPGAEYPLVTQPQSITTWSVPLCK